MDTLEKIRADFLAGHCSFIDAIERLGEIGHDPRDAEQFVIEWEEKYKVV